MTDVTIVGAGLAGLCCAVRLEQAGMSVKLLEADDAPGGRIRTDRVEGFRLDRGFQLLLTGYPELAQHIDLKALRLRAFSRGALVWHGGRFHHFADPFRGSLGSALSIAMDPIITISDKMRIVQLRNAVKRGEAEDLFRARDQSTRDLLEEYGFSAKAMERFFIPFLAGVFLERELATSSRYFRFIFRMFASSDAAVPENGMEMLPRQLAVRLRTGTLETGVRVTSLRRNGRNLLAEAEKGREYSTAYVVLAIDDAQVHSLLQKNMSDDSVQWNPTTTFYYAAARTPIDGPLLALNGEGSSAGPLNHAVVVSQASERYAPPGWHLVAANVVGRAPQSPMQIEQLERDVRAQLVRWFGKDAAGWSVVGGYPIAQALPLCVHAEWRRSQPRLADNIYVCGDYRETPSIDGALASGRRAAEAVLRDAS